MLGRRCMANRHSRRVEPSLCGRVHTHTRERMHLKMFIAQHTHTAEFAPNSESCAAKNCARGGARSTRNGVHTHIARRWCFYFGGIYRRNLSINLQLHVACVCVCYVCVCMRVRCAVSFRVRAQFSGALFSLPHRCRYGVAVHATGRMAHVCDGYRT